jgi:hypothetical protein
MSPIAALAYRGMLILLAGFAGVTIWKLFTQGMCLDGLLRDNNNEFSPGRAQMLLVTLLTAMQFLFQVIQHPTAFPEIPDAWLAALGASHGVYLGAKAFTIFGNRSNSS